jgi:hypothetical protein
MLTYVLVYTPHKHNRTHAIGTLGLDRSHTLLVEALRLH